MMNSDPEGGTAMMIQHRDPSTGYLVLSVDHEPMVPFDDYDVASYAHFDDVPVTAVHMLAGESLLLVQDLDFDARDRLIDCDCPFCS
jgi:hypothetical protein